MDGYHGGSHELSLGSGGDGVNCPLDARRRGMSVPYKTGLTGGGGGVEYDVGRSVE